MRARRAWFSTGALGALTLLACGCQRTAIIEDLRPEAVSISEEDAREVLGNEARVLHKWGEVTSCRWTSYDVYHLGEAGVPKKILVTILTLPIFLIEAPFFGLTETVETEFSSGRVWKREFRRHWLWFFPLHASPGWEYAEALVKECGAGTGGQPVPVPPPQPGAATRVPPGPSGAGRGPSSGAGNPAMRSPDRGVQSGKDSHEFGGMDRRLTP